MSPAGITYFLGVSFWTLTALYGVLSSQDFIQEQFLAPRLFTPLAFFADWHWAIGILILAGWTAARKWASTEAPSGRTWTAASAWVVATVLLAVAAPLSAHQTTNTALLIVGAGGFLVLLLAAAELRMVAEPSREPSRDRSRADLMACLLCAVGVTIVYAVASAALNGVSATLPAAVFESVRLHLLLAGGTFLVLATVRSAAALTPWPVLSETVLSTGALAAALAVFLANVALASISMRGPVALAIAAGLGVALACAAAARARPRAVAHDGVVNAFSALSPPIAARPWGLSLWLGCLLLFVIGVMSASRTADWSFVLLHSGIALSWMLALSGALTFSQRVPDGGARTSFAVVLLLLGGHAALKSAVQPVQAAEMRNASASWLADMLGGGVRTEGVDGLVRLLHSQTNIPRDTPVAAVDVNLAELHGGPAAVRPNVFVFVVDSLRRDYLSPYNSAVTFTPSIAALAQDSLVFHNAYTQYGATGLSVPSIWVGGPILHKQYVSSFPRMNTLAKLLAHEQYEQWVGMDNIMNVILPPSDLRTPLDQAVAVKDFRLCRTLTEIRSRLAARSPDSSPVFVYSLPQDVHVSVVTREGSTSIDARDYSGFYAPVASRVARLDQCLGEFIGDLKARGLYDQSIIVVTSDHGDSLGEEGRMGHAYSLHPEIVRVPLILHVPPSMRSAWAWDERRPSFSTDITPTLYRLLGHEPTRPAPFFGESLAQHPGAAPSGQSDRMVAASYGAVYGALLDGATRYYVFDAIAMREMAFELGSGSDSKQVPVTADIQGRGLKVIRDTVNAVAGFYGFPTAPDSGS